MSKFSLLDMQYSLPKKPFLKPGKPARSMLRRSSPPPKISMPDGDEMRSVLEKFDTNKDGKVSVEEYCSAMERPYSGRGQFQRSRTPKLQSNFEELWEMMKRLGEGCSSEACRTMVRRAVTNRDGKVDMDEFVAMVTTRTMKQH
ncbi:hypothetical protein MLD38_028894 [Melastoma candidum]|uniref:Uncharacterized protein n=1 Tax=Melastoma candidum TaxID=119954 RepID=A0ACB9N2Y2_9MYRT|nr:hypothetical protein MLD38_028894 [Melastoma candidum]